jgi:acyl-CoA synthetase (AMP-forming)/AMP-acid ligase II
MMRRHGIPRDARTNGSPRTTGSPEAVDLLEAALSHCPEPGSRPSTPPWHELLYERLRDRALPAVIADGTITPAASLWTGSRLWTQAFRAGDLDAGDRLVVDLPPSAAFIQVLVAAIWCEYTVVLAPPSAEADALLDPLDARAAVTSTPGPHAWTPEGCSGPRTTPDRPRPASTPAVPDVRFLLRTSGTTGAGRWVALSDRNVLSVLASHLPHFRLCDARVLSVLPWSHAFGLVLDLLSSLLAGAEIIRDPNGGRDPADLVSLSEAWGSTHLNAVPLTVQRLTRHPDGPDLLSDLRGGIVGGAPVSGPLASVLEDTRLRVGYGQTEAAPGIALGAPGDWAANYLGQPVGCEVDIDDGELCFRGANACVGFWTEAGLERRDPERTVRTGDLADRKGDDLFFRGRADDAFKLSNGRFVQAGRWEAELKGTLSGVRDALLFTPDGTRLGVALRMEGGEAPPLDRVRPHLGPLADRLRWCTAVPDDAWAETPKGSVDRPAMTRTLADRYADA